MKGGGGDGGLCGGGGEGAITISAVTTTVGAPTSATTMLVSLKRGSLVIDAWNELLLTALEITSGVMIGIATAVLPTLLPPLLPPLLSSAAGRDKMDTSRVVPDVCSTDTSSTLRPGMPMASTMTSASCCNSASDTSCRRAEWLTFACSS